MNNKKFKYLVLSDIHFGSGKNKTQDIVDHLHKYFKEYNDILSKVDMIFLAGDVYEKLLSNSSLDSILSLEWLTLLANYCKRYKIKLRILEGTPSHDNKQIKVLNTVLNKLKIDIDFKYVEDIHIEYIKEYDINILYVPDEMNHDANDTLKQIKDLLEDKSLVQVDIAIMHGAFKYQIPVIELPGMHDEQEYMNLVKHYISIGHIHSSSIYRKILAQGSFDRLAHNEEEDKGGMVITIENNEASFIFLKNKYATIFKTIDILSEDVTEVIEYLEIKLKDIVEDSHIRLKVLKDNPVSKSLLEIYKKFNKYNFISKMIDNIDDNLESKVSLKSVVANGEFDNLQINKDNITKLLLKEIDIESIDINKQNIIKEELSNLL